MSVDLNRTTTSTDLDFDFENAATGISFGDLNGSLFFLGPQLYKSFEETPTFAAEEVALTSECSAGTS